MAFVPVGVGATQRIPLSVLARNPHQGLAHEIFHETGRRRVKEGPIAEQRSEQSRAVSWREQATATTCGLRGRVGQHERVS